MIKRYFPGKTKDVIFYKNFIDYSKTSYRIFYCETFEIILFDYNYDLSRIFIKFKDDEFWYELKDSSMSSCGGETHFSITNTYNNEYVEKFDLYIKDDNAFFLAGFSYEFLQETSTLKNLLNERYQEIPKIREVNQRFQINSLCATLEISRLKYTYKEEKLNLIFPISNENIELKVINKEMYRDGGTTFYYTDKGVLYIPTPFNKTLKPTWDKEEIIVIEIQENDRSN